MWWTAFTPGTSVIFRPIAATSISPGTPSSDRRRLSRVSDQTDATITAATTSPTTGSTIVQPVHEITSPETSTPTDTSASAAMCRYAPLTFRSRSLSFRNSHAVKPLIATPTPAVQAMAPPSTGAGCRMRPMLSATITPTAISRITEFNSEISTVLFL